MVRSYPFVSASAGSRRYETMAHRRDMGVPWGARLHWRAPWVLSTEVQPTRAKTSNGDPQRNEKHENEQESAAHDGH